MCQMFRQALTGVQFYCLPKVLFSLDMFLLLERQHELTCSKFQPLISVTHTEETMCTNFIFFVRAMQMENSQIWQLISVRMDRN